MERGEQPNMSATTLKKTRVPRSKKNDDADMLAEYRFDYSKAKPNRFADQAKEGYRTVLLDPDIAAIFTTAEFVNAILRALINTILK
jgi:hypothetical protein